MPLRQYVCTAEACLKDRVLIFETGDYCACNSKGKMTVKKAGHNARYKLETGRGLCQGSIFTLLTAKRVTKSAAKQVCDNKSRVKSPVGGLSYIIIQHIDTLPKYGKKNSGCT